MKPEQILNQSGYEQFRSTVRDRGLPPGYVDFSGDNSVKEIRELTGWDNEEVNGAINKIERDEMVPFLKDNLAIRLAPWLLNDALSDELPIFTVKEIARLTGFSAEKIISLVSNNAMTFGVNGSKVQAQISDWPEGVPPTKSMGLSDAGIYGVSPKRVIRDSRFQSRASGGGPIQKSGIRTDKLGPKILLEAKKERKIQFVPQNSDRAEPNQLTDQEIIQPIQLVNQGISPSGQISQELLNRGNIGLGSFVPDGLIPAMDRMNLLTRDNFAFGLGIQVPESINKDGQQIKPMIYINERPYGFPDESFSQIPELIVFNDSSIMKWLVENGNLESMTGDDTLWVFPGNGGIYMRDQLATFGVSPTNTLEIFARRYWTDEGIICKTALKPEDAERISKLESVSNIVLVDDTIATGLTALSVIDEIGKQMKYDSLTIIVQALATPRKKESLSALLGDLPISPTVLSGIFYGGESQRPRLLTTGSIVDGIKDPERFSAKKYPPELIEQIFNQLQLSHLSQFTINQS